MAERLLRAQCQDWGTRTADAVFRTWSPGPLSWCSSSSGMARPQRGWPAAACANGRLIGVPNSHPFLDADGAAGPFVKRETETWPAAAGGLPNT